MIASNSNSSEEPEGGLGGVVPTGGIRDTRLLEKATRQRWPITEKQRAAVVKSLAGIVGSRKASRREITAAARALVAAESQNQADEHHSEGEQVYHEHTGEIGLVPMRQELANDPEYLEYLRNRTVETNGDPGAVCPNGEPRTLENGAAPDAPGPGHNGHHSNGGPAAD